MSSKYGQKFLDITKMSATDDLKTSSKKMIQKAAETTCGLVGNKIADFFEK